MAKSLEKVKRPTLSGSESADLAACERIIKEALIAYDEAGRALERIRDEALYRETHATFDDYCRDRWAKTRIHVFRMIEASKVADNLLPMGNIPASERVARPLSQLTPNQQREAWSRALATAPGGHPTGAHVKAIVDEMKAETSTEMSEKALLPKANFACSECPNIFDREVWHCPGCDHHWVIEVDDECRNCHSYERCPDGTIRQIQFEDEENEQPDEEPATEAAKAPEIQDWEEASKKWTELINHFSFVNASLERRGGIANLSRHWSRQNREGFARTIADIIRVFESILAELKESLDAPSGS